MATIFSELTVIKFICLAACNLEQSVFFHHLQLCISTVFSVVFRFCMGIRFFPLVVNMVLLYIFNFVVVGSILHLFGMTFTVALVSI